MKQQLLILLFSLMPFLAFGQQERFQIKDYSTTLAQCQTGNHCAFQDHLGTLWIGNDEGLFSFDGRTLNKHSLSAQGNDKISVNTITEDGSQTLWIGTSIGVFSVGKNGFEPLTALTDKKVSVSSKVNKLLSSGENLWVATEGQGLFLYHKKEGTLTHIDQYAVSYTDLLEDKQQVYALTFSGALLSFNLSGKFLNKIPLSSDLRNKCLAASAQYIWAGTAQQVLFKVNKKTLAVEKIHYEDAPFRNIYCMLSTQKGIFLGTDYGAYEIAPEGNGKLEILLDKFGDPIANGEKDIRGICQDQEGGIWFMTAMDGVQRISSSGLAVRNINTANHQQVSALCTDSKTGQVWVGTRNGLFILDKEGKGMQPVNLKNDTHKPLEIKALCQDGSDLWIGIYGTGLAVYHTQTGVMKMVSIGTSFINKIYKTREGVLYVGSDQGLFLYQDGEFKLTELAKKNDSVYDILEDSRGNLWISTARQNVFFKEAGAHDFVLKYHPGKTSTLNLSNTECLCEDYEGNIWVSFNEKLYSYSYPEDQFKAYAHRALTDIPKITALEAGQDQYLWIGTFNGLIQLDLNSKSNYQLFNNASGLARDFVSPKCLYLSPSGMIVVGNPLGLSLVNTQSIPSTHVAPTTYLSNIFFYNRNHEETNEDILGTKEDIRTMQRLVIPHHYNHFLLYLSSSSLENPQNNHFAYKIDGVDKEWIELPGNYFVVSNLSPGKYKLHIKNTNNASPQDEKERTVWIEIVPPWWMTTWAYLCYLCLFIGLVAVGVKGWNAHIKNKYNQSLEEYKLAKEQEFYKAKFMFFTNLIHEIRTPLTLIKLPLESLESRAEEDMESLETIDRNVNHLLNITNELLDFQKAETGSITLNPVSCDIKELIKETTRIFKQELASKGITLKRILPEENVTAVVDKAKISRVLINLLSNAIKYAREEITIQLKSSSHELEISVEDDGTGISDSKKELVFQPFFQQDDEKAFLGTGLGLPYSRSIVECHKGTLYALDAMHYPTGTAMVLTLPCHALSEKKIVNLQAAASLENTPAQTPEDELSFREKRFTILIVEDNIELQRALASSLKPWYAVRTASNGLEALDILKRDLVDVIVSDLMMPEMDGVELCREIRKNEDYLHISFILLTAKITLETKEEGLKAGADVFMEKPFSITQLHSQIENILQSHIRFHQRIQQISSRLGQEEAINAGINQNEYKFINRLNKIINENITDDLTIEVLASMLNMSRSSFYRKLKSLSDLTPNDYVRNYRLDMAADLIAQGKQITQVYEETGFKSSSYFSKCFKDKFGLLPKEYQKQHLGTTRDE